MRLAEQLNVVSESDGEADRVADLVVDNLDTWTSAIKSRSSASRGGGSKREIYGIKKLRELILELAVRGLLVPQDPNEETASELLKKIDTKKTRLVKEGKIKKQKHFPAISDKEKPFDIPKGWELERVGNLVSKLGSGSTPRGGKSAYVEKGIPFLRSQNVWNEGLKLEDIAYIPIDTHEKMVNTKVFPGDILLNITGASLGRSTIFPAHLVEANVSQHVTIIRLLVSEMARFVHLGILSPMIQKLVWGRQVGMAIEGLSKKVLELFEFPIPPLEEQHRIVAKVDELMALCDQLEQQTEASLTAHETLVETLLGALTNAENHTSFQQAWQRIAQHFDTLFTTEHSIDQLKQTILQLAVQGKLVHQDPNDETAGELLKKIAAEKSKLLKEGKIKERNSLRPISDEAKPFDLPQGWDWCFLNELITLMDAGWSPACPPNKSPNNETWGVLKTTAVQTLEYRENENKVLPDNKKPRPQYEVRPGDILITRAGPKNRVGISCLVEKTRPRLMISDKIIRFHLANAGMSERFISLCLNAGATSQYLESVKSGMAESQMNISQDQLKAAPIPLCPINEQYRIIAKVDKLIALCDYLKTRLLRVQSTELHLADAVTEQAINRTSIPQER